MAKDKTSAKPGTATPAPEPKPGEQWLVKHPSVDGQWQVCTILPHPTAEGAILVEFPDGSRYEAENLQIGARAETPPPAGMPNQAANARVSPLNPEYEAFRRVVVELNGQSRRMFQLPLAVLLTMASRLATQRETPGAGNMGNYDGIQLFVPDQTTFDTWLEDYLLEIQTREGGSPE
jgi:hypothetical protein